MKENNESGEITSLVKSFEKLSGLSGVDHSVKQGSTGSTLIIYVAEPSERFFRFAEEVSADLRGDDVSVVTIKKRNPSNRLQSPEAKYFLKVLSESLNINRFSFEDDFFSRYTRSVSNAEEQVINLANHIVYGRRGAGKSSLLLYAMRTRQSERLPSTWIDMQVFEKRSDNKVIVDILLEIFRQLNDQFESTGPLYSDVLRSLERYKHQDTVEEKQLRLLLPDIKRVFALIKPNFFVFLDDFHVLDFETQPKVLAYLYSAMRGNNAYLKISAIETLTKSWDAHEHSGLQVPHDAQTIKLDYNLTMPDKAAVHIEGILDAHAQYCGLPSLRFLYNSPDVLNRLIWVSAGVPRDAISMFAQAMTKGSVANRSRVSVTDVNLAASDMVSQKMRDLEVDVAAAEEEGSLSEVLEHVRDFCVKRERKNAFLVEIKNQDKLYQCVLKLIDLRLVHVISEGITVGQAGRKYLALLLDYGFYTGVRAAQSVDLFNEHTDKVARATLRRLPILPHMPA